MENMLHTHNTTWYAIEVFLIRFEINLQYTGTFNKPPPPFPQKIFLNKGGVLFTRVDYWAFVRKKIFPLRRILLNKGGVIYLGVFTVWPKKWADFEN